MFILDISAVHGIHTPPYSHLLSLVPHHPTESHTEKGRPRELTENKYALVRVSILIS